MSAPVFSRRRQSSKRRSRNSLPPVLDQPGAPSNPSPPSPPPPPSPQLSHHAPTPARTKPGRLASRARLRPPPDVPGYDIAVDPPQPHQSLSSRYTTNDLNQLRQSTVAAPSPHNPTLPLDPPKAPPKPPPPPTLKTQPSTSRFAHSQPPTRPPSRSKKPEPFSKHWQEGVIDVDASSPEPPFTENASTPFLDHTPHQIDSDSEDQQNEQDWYHQLLKRSGVKLSVSQKAAEVETHSRDDRIIRDALLNDTIAPDKAGVDDILARCNTLVENAAVAESAAKERLDRIQNAVAEAKKAGHTAANQNMEKKEKQHFFKALGVDIELLSLVLRNRHTEMVEFQQDRLKAISREALQVRDFLKAGVDEFGRAKRTGIGARWVPGDEQRREKDAENEEETAALDVQATWNAETGNISKIEDVVERFAEWEERYKEEYMSARGDVALGRLVGALATREKDLWWLVRLNSVQRSEAIKVWNVTEEVIESVRAKWQPAQEDSCEYIAQIVKAVCSSSDKVDERGVIEAVRTRLEWEASAGRRAEDWGWVWETVIGGTTLSRAVGVDVGVRRILMDTRGKLGRGNCDASMVKQAEESLKWVVHQQLNEGDDEDESVVRVVQEVLMEL